MSRRKHIPTGRKIQDITPEMFPRSFRFKPSKICPSRSLTNTRIKSDQISKENIPLQSKIIEDTQNITTKITNLKQTMQTIQDLKSTLSTKSSILAEVSSSANDKDSFKSILQEQLSSKYSVLKEKYSKMTEDLESKKSSFKAIEDRLSSLQAFQQSLISQISLKKSSIQSKSSQIRVLSHQSHSDSESLSCLSSKPDLNNLFSCY